MAAMDCTLFDTTFGRCGLAWTERGIRALQFPEATAALTVDRLWSSAGGDRRDGGDVGEVGDGGDGDHVGRDAGRPTLATLVARGSAGRPPMIEQAIAEVRGLLEGRPFDLRGIALDDRHVSPFERRVYDAAREIPAGQTVTYGELARRIDAPAASRAVGGALGRNPFVIIVPCHRVLAAGGRAGGFSAHGGLVTKMKLLAVEATMASRAPSLFDEAAGFDFDPLVAIEQLRVADPRLAELIDRVGPFRMQLDGMSDVFLALARAIVAQQLSSAAAATIFARLRALFPNGHLGFSAAQLQRVGDERLREAGLSQAKAAALRDLAARQLDGRLPDLAALRALSDEAAISVLTECRGIGRWTVEMLLMFRLGRADVLPLDDLGIRQGYSLTYPRGGRRIGDVVAALAERGQRWKPYRTVASWYLWRAVDLARQR